jgi:hypothetical protein
LHRQQSAAAEPSSIPLKNVDAIPIGLVVDSLKILSAIIVVVGLLDEHISAPTLFQIEMQAFDFIMGKDHMHQPLEQTVVLFLLVEITHRLLA